MDLSSLPPSQCRKTIASLLKRRLVNRSFPMFLVTFVTVFCIIQYRSSLEPMMKVRLADILPEGIWGDIIVTVPGYAIILFAGWIMMSCVWDYQVRRQIRRHFYHGLCFSCGYSLRGLEPEGRCVRCPECGESSPVA